MDKDDVTRPWKRGRAEIGMMYSVRQDVESIALRNCKSVVEVGGPNCRQTCVGEREGSAANDGWEAWIGGRHEEG